MTKVLLTLLIFALLVGCLSEDRGQDRAVVRGKQLFMDHGCYGCHTVGATGTNIGPDLTRVGAKYDMAYLTEWLRDPAKQRPTAHMPKIAMGEEDGRALAAYLASLR
jgi:putative heme-binding domain-containing protein